MIWLTALRAASACEPPGPALDRVWPGDTAPADTVIVLLRSQTDEPVVVIGPGRVEVEATVGRFPGTAEGQVYEVIAPTTPLEVDATYTIDAGELGSWSFEVVDGVTEPVAPPVPVWRNLETGLDYFQVPCVGSPATVDTVEYRLCGEGVLHLVATGPDEPPAPSFDAPGEVWASVADVVSLAGAIGAGEDFTGKLWFGALDGAGGFSGWSSPDEITMPPDDNAEYVEVSGEPPAEPGGAASDTAGGTPTRSDTCPAEAGWGEPVLQFCPQRDGYPVCRTVKRFHKCGCEGAPLSGGWASLVVLGVVLGARRRGGGAT